MKETFWGHFKIAGHFVIILSQNLMIKKMKLKSAAQTAIFKIKYSNTI